MSTLHLVTTTPDAPGTPGSATTDRSTSLTSVPADTSKTLGAMHADVRGSSGRPRSRACPQTDQNLGGNACRGVGTILYVWPCILQGVRGVHMCVGDPKYERRSQTQHLTVLRLTYHRSHASWWRVADCKTTTATSVRLSSPGSTPASRCPHSLEGHCLCRRRWQTRVGRCRPAGPP